MFKGIAVLAWACIGAFVLLVLYANYDAYLSPEAIRAKRVGRAIRRVRVGMDTTQVAAIMGKAEEISRFQQARIYHYTHQPGASASYQIKFDANCRVIEVNILD